MSAAMSDPFEAGLAGREVEFGKKWTLFLTDLTVPQIYHAEKLLTSRLELERLHQKSFLDVGCGGGLISLAARRLGARVISFDSDPHAIASARELRRRYFPDDPDWQIEQGSVLDSKFLGTLNTFDIVWANDVLNHSGAMNQALENVRQLVAVGGRLEVAIYQDHGPISARWDRLKGIYHKLPRPLRDLFGVALIARTEGRPFLAHLRRGNAVNWLKGWAGDRDNANDKGRWRAWMDWLGNYPYERASVEEVIEASGREGFRLIAQTPPTSIADCVNFSFYRSRPGFEAGQNAPSGRSRSLWQLSPSTSFHRVVAPLSLTDDGWAGTVVEAPDTAPGSDFALFRDGKLVGPTTVEGTKAVVARRSESAGALSEAEFYVVGAEARQLLPPFNHERGRMWSTTVPELATVADDVKHGARSPLLMFEDGVQLRKPHSAHDEIAQRGGGHFSHWEVTIYFSTSDGSDPNFNGKTYFALIDNDQRADILRRSKFDRNELAVTPEMISAGVSILDAWEREHEAQGDSGPTSSTSKVKLVSAIYDAMRAAKSSAPRDQIKHRG